MPILRAYLLRRDVTQTIIHKNDILRDGSCPVLFTILRHGKKNARLRCPDRAGYLMGRPERWGSQGGMWG